MEEWFATDSVEESIDSTSMLCGFHPEHYAGYFANDTLLHTELPYHSWGESATPLPYLLQRDDLVSSCLILCLFMLVYAYNKTRKQLRRQTKEFFTAPRAHVGPFAVETSYEVQARILIIFILSFMGGLAMFSYAQYRFHTDLEQLSTHWLMGIYVTSFLVMLVIKRIITNFVNWVFFPKSQQKMWQDNASYINSIEALHFFPLLLAFIFFHLPFEKTILFFLFILLIFKFILSFKAYGIFFAKSHGIFHLFAYLCALELMPLLALWKLLAIVTENLVVKY